MPRIDITKSVFGNYRVGYDCPVCGERLRSPISDAGTQDVCPNCNIQYVVPGTKERDQLNREKQAELKHKRQVAEQIRKIKQEKQRENIEARVLVQEEEEFRRQRREAIESAKQQAARTRAIKPSAEIKCPVCKSTQITPNKKGFGLGKAVVGGLLLGPIGLLGGVIGSDKIKITCLACGHVFEPGQRA